VPVTFYDPGGRIAAASRQDPLAPPAKRPRSNTGKGIGQDRIQAALAASRVAGPTRSAVPPPEPEEPSGPGGLLGRGLGMVLNNPITNTILRPLDVLDVPRRAVWSTIQEASDYLQDNGDASFQDWYDQTNPLHAVTQRGDTTFGAGDVIPEVDTMFGAGVDKWLNRGIGLAGDIIADPLTYVDGIGFVADAGTLASRVGRMTKIEEGVRALEQTGRLTDDILEGAKRVAQSGNWGRADPLLREAAGVSDTAGVRMRVPFTRAVSGPIPGTKYLGGKAANLIGGVKGGINASDWGRARIANNAPSELSSTLPVMLGGAGVPNDRFRKALESIPYTHDQRLGANKIKALGAADLGQTVRQVKEYLRSGGTIDDLIRDTEDLTKTTPLNVLADRVRQNAADLGVDMPEIADIGYFPHVLSREFKDMLEAGGEDVQRFMDQSQIIGDELTGDGGFLQGRKLRPRNGQPLTITLDNGRSVTITEGTVAEINAKMKELFPKLEGTALETDPRTALERYIDSVADDIGNRYAQNQALARDSQFIGRDPAGIVDEVGGVGPEGPGLLQGPVPSARGPQVVARGEDPFANNPLFRGVRDEDLSTLANEQEAGALARQLEQEQAQAQLLRTTAAGDISNTGRQVRQGLEEGQQAINTQLAGDLAPVNARLADINTTRADLGIADELAAERLGQVNEDITNLRARNEPIGREIVANKQEIRRINASVPPVVDGLRDYLKSINARIAGYRSQFRRLTKNEQAAWRTAREGDVANARAELARLQEEAEGLRTWGSETQDRLNYQIADKALSDFNNEIKATQAELDRITGITQEVNRLGVGRPPNARIEEARRYLEPGPNQNPNVERYDEAIAKVNAHKAGEKVNAEELAQARKYLRTKAAKNVPAHRKILDDLAAQDQMVGKRVAQDPEVRAAQRAAANADLKTKRTPAIGHTIGDPDSRGIYVDEAEVRRLFPEAGINPREVPFTEYLQRLRRSYGQENTRARAGRLRENVAQQEAEMAKANRGLEDLFRGDVEKTIEARNQADYMWKTFPEEMRKQQVQEQIVSIPARAQVQMETLDAINTNLRMDYKVTLFNRQRREAERAAIENQLGRREAARTNLGSQEAALEAQAASLTGEAATARQYIANVQGVPGRRSIDPAADIAGGKTLAPKGKVLKDFDLQTDPARLQPMNQVLNDIQTMARFDPNMTDEVYGATESLLMQHRQMLREVSGQDLTARQTEMLLREANSGRLLDVVAGQLRDTWTMLPGRGDTYIDSELNRMLTNIIDVKKEPGAFGRTLTAFTNFFKTYATLTPGFHIRNAMSAVFMNTVDGVPLRTQREGLALWRQFEKAEDPAQWLRGQSKEIQDAFDATFASGAGGRFLESGVAQSTASGRSRLKEGVYRNRVTTKSQEIGQHVEGSVRLGMALDSTRNGASAAAAYDRLARIHFDYASVSKLDEQAKRLVPFWTFTSRNLPMQISEMWKKPKVYAWYNSFVRNFAVDPAEFTPEYFESVGAWNTGETVAGLPLYLQPDLPHVRVREDIDRFTKALQGENIGQVASDLNPFFTAPVEYVTGQDLYTGRQYKDTDWTKAEGAADAAMLPIMALLGQTKKGADGTYYQDKGMNALRAINPLLDRSIRLIPGASSSSGDPSRQYEAIARTLGIPIRTLSPQQQESTRRSAYYDQLDQAAMERVLAGGQP
jgi:hypothetical protein